MISGTPIDLRRLLKVNKPVVRIGYELAGSGILELKSVIKNFARGITRRKYRI